MGAIRGVKRGVESPLRDVVSDAFVIRQNAFCWTRFCLINSHGFAITDSRH